MKTPAWRINLILPDITMVANEEFECIVCCSAYSCVNRIPRILHCKHTFCASCLKRMTKCEGILNTVICPLCRWITCTRASQTLSGALWVNTEIWDQMLAKEKKEEDLEEILKDTKWSKRTNPRKSGLKSAFQKLLSRALSPKRHVGSN